MRTKRKAAAGAVALATAVAFIAPLAVGVTAAAASTNTPIQHLVVIYQENVSFDHYFGTYPNATNADGTPFTPKAGTPAVNGLSGALLSANPNGVNPARYANSSAAASGQQSILTCDENHNYADEQTAFNGGAMNKFVSSVGTTFTNEVTGAPCRANEVMNYYDGNSVTGMWNYAQQFAMSDNSYGTTFGPSSPGAINLISGNSGNVDTTGCSNLGGAPPTHAFASSATNGTLVPINPSGSVADNLLNTVLKPYPPTGVSKTCFNAGAGQSAGLGIAGQQGRCGLGPRLPLVAISCFARSNYVDHALSDQSSITKFILGNWGLPAISSSFTGLSYNNTASNPTYNAEGPLANMFDFSNGAQDTAGCNPYYLDVHTGSTTNIPTPLVPDAKTPTLFVLTGLAMFIGYVTVRRRRNGIAV